MARTWDGRKRRGFEMNQLAESSKLMNYTFN